MKTWTTQLNAFKAKALSSLEKIITISDYTPAMGIVFYVDNNKQYDSICFYNHEWCAFNKKNEIVKALDIDTETLMSMIDAIHHKYNYDNLNNK